MSIFKRKEYVLENAVEQNRNNPRHFLKPSDDEIHSLKTGDVVKLIFLLNKPLKNGCRAERMWITIKKIAGNEFTGILENKPYYLKTINAGDEVVFSSENIAAIILNNSIKFDESKFAIITKKALERREINWLVRTESLNDPKDSGWQLFYGDEDNAYLDNINNASIILLSEALNFEPLLEKPFTENGFSYKYSKNKNMFIEVKD